MSDQPAIEHLARELMRHQWGGWEMTNRDASSPTSRVRCSCGWSSEAVPNRKAAHDFALAAHQAETLAALIERTRVDA